MPEGCPVACAAPCPQPRLAAAGHRELLFAQPVASGPEDGARCEIKATPLIDSLLVLLVRLIVSLPLMSHSVGIVLAQLGAHCTAVPRPITDLVSDFDGTQTWTGTPVAGLSPLQDDLQAAPSVTPA